MSERNLAIEEEREEVSDALENPKNRKIKGRKKEGGKERASDWGAEEEKMGRRIRSCRVGLGRGKGHQTCTKYL